MEWAWDITPKTRGTDKPVAKPIAPDDVAQDNTLQAVNPRASKHPSLASTPNAQNKNTAKPKDDGQRMYERTRALSQKTKQAFMPTRDDEDNEEEEEQRHRYRKRGFEHDRSRDRGYER